MHSGINLVRIRQTKAVWGWQPLPTSPGLIACLHESLAARECERTTNGLLVTSTVQSGGIANYIG